MKQSKPEPISADELYENPAPGAQWPRPDPPTVGEEVVPFPQQEAVFSRPRPEDPEPPVPPMPGPKPKDRAAVFSILLDILSFRLIMLLCAMSSAGLFVMASLWPDPWRLAAASAFSAIITAPVIFFYRKGG